MAGTTTQKVVLSFTANTKSALAEINSLAAALERVKSVNLSSLGMDDSLNRAAKAAQELESHLQSAINVNTGKLNLVAFNNSIKSSNQSLSELMSRLALGGNAGAEAFQKMASAIASSQAPIKQTNALLNNMMTTLKNTAKWQLSSNIIHGFQGAIQGAIGYVQQLNNELNNIRIVTGKNTAEMAQFAEAANKAAKSLSTTTKDFTKASLIYFQQGDTQAQAMEKAAITTKAANVAFSASAKEMSEMLTAVWNSYQAGSDQLEHMVDVMAQLGATTASSMEEMATGMQKVAATANTVGVSMEKMSAIIATSASVTRQAPQTIGTAWNTILSRLGGLKLGETLEDGVDLNKYSNALKSIGVNILDSANNLREMGSIIDEIGDKWTSLGSAQKSALAQTIGGARQYTQILAFFENFDKYQKNLNTAMNSNGALNRQAATYAESWEAASQRVENTLQHLYTSLLDDKDLIKFENGLNGVLEQVDGLVSALGGLKGISGTLGSVLLGVFANKLPGAIHSITDGIKNLFMDPKALYRNALDQTASEIATGATGNTSQAVQLTQDLIDRKRELLAIEGSLSSAQAENLSKTLELLGNEIGEIAKLEAAYNDLNKTMERSTNNFVRRSNMGGVNLVAYGELGAKKFNSISSPLTEENATAQILSGIQKTQNLSSRLGVEDTRLSVDNWELMNDKPKLQMEALKIAIDSVKGALQGMSTEWQAAFADINSADISENNFQELVVKVRGAISSLTPEVQAELNILTSTIEQSVNALPEGTLKNSLTTELRELLNTMEQAPMSGQQFEAALRSIGERSEEAKQKIEAAETSFNKVISVMGQLASAAGSSMAAFNGMSNSVKALNTGTANVGTYLGMIISVLPGLTMGVRTLGTAVKTAITEGGTAMSALMSTNGIVAIISIIATLTMAIVGAVEGARKARIEAEKEAQEARKTKADTASEAASTEANDIKELIAQYNSLYATYTKTGEGQDKLASSAEKLAEKMELVGASVLIASGNFEGFNDLLHQSLNFDNQIKTLENAAKTYRELLSGDAVKGTGSEGSQYRLTKTITNQSRDVSANWTNYEEDVLWDLGDIEAETTAEALTEITTAVNAADAAFKALTDQTDQLTAASDDLAQKEATLTTAKENQAALEQRLAEKKIEIRDASDVVGNQYSLEQTREDRARQQQFLDAQLAARRTARNTFESTSQELKRLANPTWGSQEDFNVWIMEQQAPQMWQHTFERQSGETTWNGIALKSGEELLLDIVNSVDWKTALEDYGFGENVIQERLKNNESAWSIFQSIEQYLSQQSPESLERFHSDILYNYGSDETSASLNWWQAIGRQMFWDEYESEESLRTRRADLEAKQQAAKTQLTGLNDAIAITQDNLKFYDELIEQYSALGEKDLATLETEKDTLESQIEGQKRIVAEAAGAVTAAQEHKEDVQKKQKAYEDAQTELDRLKAEQAKVEHLQEMKQIDENTQAFFGEGSKYRTLFDEQGNFKWNNESYESKKVIFSTVEDLVRESASRREELMTKLAEAEEQNDTATVDFLTNQIAEYDEFEQAMEPIIGQNSVVRETMIKARDIDANIKNYRLLSEHTKKLIGQAPGQGDYTKYSAFREKVWAPLRSDVEKQADSEAYADILGVYLERDKDNKAILQEDGTFKVQEKYKTQYEAAVNRLTKQFLGSYTEFGDWAGISADLEGMFNTEQMAQIDQLIETQNLTYSDITSTFIAGLKAFFAGATEGITEDATLKGIIANRKAEVARIEKESIATSFQSIGASYKSNMSIADATKLSSWFFGADSEKWKADYLAHQQELGLTELKDNAQLTGLTDTQRANYFKSVSTDYARKVYPAIVKNDLEAAQAELKRQQTDTESPLSAYLTDGKISAALLGDIKSFNATQTSEGKWTYTDAEGKTVTTDKMLEALQHFTGTSGFDFAGQTGTEAWTQLTNLVTAYQSADSEVTRLQALSDILNLIGDGAETAASKVNKLSAAFKTLPSTTEDLDTLVELINQSDKRQGKNAVTAQSLISSYYATNKSGYYQAILDGIDEQIKQKEFTSAGARVSASVLSKDTEYQLLKREQAKLKGEKELYDLQHQSLYLSNSTAITQYAADLTKLQGIDISQSVLTNANALATLNKYLKEGSKLTQDNAASQKDLEAAWSNLTETQRSDKVYAAQKNLLEKEKTATQGLMNSYEAKYKFKAEDRYDSTKLAEYENDATKWTAWQEYIKYLDEIEKLEQEITNNPVKASESRISILTKEAERLKTALNTAKAEADKLQKASTTMAQNVQTKQLNYVQQAQLKSAGINVAEWQGKDVNERARAAADAAAQAAAKGAVAYATMGQAITNAAGELNKITLATETAGASTFRTATGFETYLTDVAHVTDSAKTQIMAAYQQLIANGETFSGKTNAQILAMVKTQMAQMKKDNNDLWSDYEASGKDAVKEIYEALVTQTQTTAQTVITLWEQAFTQIANLKQSILSDNNLIGNESQNIETWTQDYIVWMNSRKAKGLDHSQATYLQQMRDNELDSSDFNTPITTETAIENYKTLWGLTAQQGGINAEGNFIGSAKAWRDILYGQDQWKDLQTQSGLTKNWYQRYAAQDEAFDEKISWYDLDSATRGKFVDKYGPINLEAERAYVNDLLNTQIRPYMESMLTTTYGKQYTKEQLDTILTDWLTGTTSAETQALLGKGVDLNTWMSDAVSVATDSSKYITQAKEIDARTKQIEAAANADIARQEAIVKEQGDIYSKKSGMATTLANIEDVIAQGADAAQILKTSGYNTWQGFANALATAGIDITAADLQTKGADWYSKKRGFLNIGASTAWNRAAAAEAQIGTIRGTQASILQGNAGTLNGYTWAAVDKSANSKEAYLAYGGNAKVVTDVLEQQATAERAARAKGAAAKARTSEEQLTSAEKVALLTGAISEIPKEASTLASVTSLVKKSGIKTWKDILGDTWETALKDETVKLKDANGKEIDTALSSLDLTTLTAAQLSAIAQQHPDIYRDLLIAAGEKYVASSTLPEGAEKTAMEADLAAMKKTDAQLAIESELAGITDSTEKLKTQLTTLQGVDITALPQAGTAAYTALNEALTAVNVSMEKLTTGSGSDKIKALYAAQRLNIQKQIEDQDSIMKKYESIGTQYTDAETAKLKLTETEYAKWEKYQEAKETKASLQRQKEDRSAENKALQAAYEQARKATEARADALYTKKIAAQQAGAELLSNTEVIQSGQLTATQALTLKQSQLSIDAKAFNEAADAEARGALAAKAWSEYIGSMTKKNELLNKDITSIENAYNNYWEEIFSRGGYKLSQIVNDEHGMTNLDSFLNADIWQGLDDSAKGVLKEAYAYAQQQIADMSTATNADVLGYVMEYLNTASLESSEAFEKIRAQGMDAMKAVWKGMAQEAQTVANEVLTVWENTFTQIANLRKKMLSGESIMGDVTQNLSSFITAYLNSGESDVNTFWSKVQNGTATFTLPTYSTEKMLAAWGMSGDTSGYDTTKNEFLSYTDWYNKLVTKYTGAGMDSDEAKNKAATLIEGYITNYLSTLFPNLSSTQIQSEFLIYKGGKTEGTGLARAGEMKDIVSQYSSAKTNYETWTETDQGVKTSLTNWNTELDSLQQTASVMSSGQALLQALAQRGDKTIKNILFENGNLDEASALKLINTATGGNYTKLEGLNFANLYNESFGTISTNTKNQNAIRTAQIAALKAEADAIKYGGTYTYTDAEGKQQTVNAGRERKVESYVTENGMHGARLVTYDVENDPRYKQITAEIDKLTADMLPEQVAGTAADQTTPMQKIAAYAAALNGLPTDTNELNNLVKYYNQYLSKKEENGLATASSLSDLQRTDARAYRTAMLNAAREEAQQYAVGTTSRVNADAQIRQLELQNADLTVQEEQAPIQTKIEGITKSLQDLQATDISSLPAKGSVEYKKLETALGKTDVKLDDLYGTTGTKRIENYYKAQRALMKQQADETGKLINTYKTVDIYKELFDQQGNLISQDAAIKKGLGDKWNEIHRLQEQQTEYTEQSESKAAENAAKIKEYATAFSRYQARQAEQQDKINKAQSTAQILSTHITDGQLSALDEATLKANKFSKEQIANFKAATSAETRAQIAAQAHSDTLEQQQKLLQEQNTLYTQASVGLAQLEFPNFVERLFGQKGLKTSKEAFLNSIVGISDEARGQLGVIWDEAEKKVGTGDAAAFIAEMQKGLNQLKDDANSAYAEIEASAINSMTEAFDSIEESSRQAAQNQIEIWKNAFDTIANLMQNMAKGETIASLLAGDVDATILAITQIMDKYNLTAEQAAEKLFSNKAGVEDFNLPKYGDLNTYMRAKGYSWLQKGAAAQAENKDVLAAIYEEMGAKQVEYDANADKYFLKGTKQEASAEERSKAASARNTMRSALRNLQLTDTRVQELSSYDKATGKGYETYESFEAALLNGDASAWAIVGGDKGLLSVISAAYSGATNAAVDKTQYQQSLTEAQDKLEDTKRLITMANTANEALLKDTGHWDATEIESALKSAGLESDLVSLVNDTLGLDRENITQITQDDWDATLTRLQEQRQEDAQAIADLMTGSKFASESDLESATDELIAAGGDLATILSAKVDRAMQKGGYADRASMRQGIIDRAALQGVKLTAEDLDADEELQFWGEAANAYDRVTDALKRLADSAKGTSGALSVLMDATKGENEQLKAAQELEGIIEDVFGVKVDMTWLKANNKLMQDWAKNKEGAYEALELKVLIEQAEQFGADVDAISEGLNRLNKIGNSLKFGDKLSTKGLRNEMLAIQRLMGANNAQMAKYAKAAGITWDTQATQIRDTAKGLVDYYEGIDNANTALKEQGLQIIKNAQTGEYMYAALEGSMKDVKQAMTAEDIGSILDQSQAFTNLTPDTKQILVEAVLANPDAFEAQLNPEGTATVTIDMQKLVEQDQSGQIEIQANAAGYVGETPVTGKVGGGGTFTMPSWVPEGTSTGSNSKVPKGGGGGGGGGPKKTYQKLKRPTKEIERYHEIRHQQTLQNNVLDKLSKAKDRAYGADHIKALNAEADALRRMITLQKDYLKEVEANLQTNSKLLAEAAKAAGITLQFNEDGSIKNFNELMSAFIKQYNDAMMKFNKLSAKEQEKAENKRFKEEWDQKYEEWTQLIQQYEEDVELMQTVQTEIEDLQNRISANLLEAIQTKIELHFDIDERSLSQIDRWLERYEDHLEDSTKRIPALMQKLNAYAIVDGEGNIIGGELAYLQQRAKEATEAYAVFQDMQASGALEGDGLNKHDYVEAMQDIADRWEEILGEIEDTVEVLHEVYSSTLDIANEDMEHYTKQFDHIHDTMESYIELQQLLGRGQRASELTKFYDAELQASQAALKQSTTHLNELRRQRELAQEAWAQATGEQAEILKETIETLDDAIIEAEDTQLEHWQQALNDAQAILENKTAAWLETLDQAIDDALGIIGGFDQLASDYEYYKTVQEEYVSTSKELYEVSKLNRQIEDSIADATTKTSKERLKALQEVINKQSESTRLTEYDIKMMELQYKHALALQELEDAKNAKSVVRLTRDENGNYGYQYTADDAAINEARQKVEDALQEINELAADRASELEQMQIETLQNYYDRVAEINADTTLSDEERNRKQLELAMQTQEQLLFIQSQYANASEALIKNQEYVQERYGTTILENTGKLQDQMNTVMATMIMTNAELAEKILAATEEGGSIYDALLGHSDDLAATTATTEQSWEDITSSVDSATEQIASADQALQDLNTTFQTVGTTIIDQINKWGNLGKLFDEFLSQAEGVDTSFQHLFTTLAGGFDEVGLSLDTTGEMSEATDRRQFGFMWTYRGYHGYLSGFDSEARARASGEDDIRAEFVNFMKEEEKSKGKGMTQAQINQEYQKWITEATKGLYIFQYHTGGLNDYTGPAWLDGTPQQPELVLNSSDTANMLDIVQGVRNLINSNVLGMLYGLGSLSAASINGAMQEWQQNVQITAEFPNATDHNEIEQAFNDIINMASQYANRVR